MSGRIPIKDKFFKPYIRRGILLQRIEELAAEINIQYAGKNPLFIALLNGSFIFAAELFQRIIVDAEISFVKLSSYSGAHSSGKVHTSIGLDASLLNRHLIIIEDIVDTGLTIHNFLPEINAQQPSSVALITLLLKPKALQFPVSCQYVGFEIPNDFVVGFGMDYEGLGRNLPELYIIDN